MLSLKDQHKSAVSTLHQIGVHGCQLRRKPLLKTIHKKAHKQFAEDMSTNHMDYWNHVLSSDEMKINLFGSDGFKHVWQRPGEEYKCVMPTVKYGSGNVMIWGCMSTAGIGKLHFIERNMNSYMYCEILLQSMIPSLQKLGHRAVFQHDDDPKHTSKTTTALLKVEGKGDGLAKHVSWLEPNRTSLGDPQAEGGGVQSLKYPPAPRSHHGGVEEHSSSYLWSSGKLHAQESKGSSG